MSFTTLVSTKIHYLLKIGDKNKDQIANKNYDKNINILFDVKTLVKSQIKVFVFVFINTLYIK